MSSRSPFRSMKLTRLPARPGVRHRSFTRPSENWALPAPITLTLIGVDIKHPFRSWAEGCGCGDKETRRQGDKETRRQGDKETRRQGDKETRRQGDKETRRQGD